MKRLLLVCIAGALLPGLQVPKEPASKTMVRNAENAAHQFFKHIGEPTYLSKEGKPKISLGQHRYGEAVIRLNYRKTNLTIEPIAGDILYVSLTYERMPGTGMVLDRKAILGRADMIAKRRLPPVQRHLCKVELIAPGSDRLDISRGRGVWLVMYREAPGDLPAFDSNMTTMSFDATNGELQDYYEVRGFKKAGPTKPRLTASDARRIVEARGLTHTTKNGNDVQNGQKP